MPLSARGALPSRSAALTGEPHRSSARWEQRLEPAAVRRASDAVAIARCRPAAAHAHTQRAAAVRPPFGELSDDGCDGWLGSSQRRGPAACRSRSRTCTHLAEGIGEELGRRSTESVSRRRRAWSAVGRYARRWGPAAPRAVKPAAPASNKRADGSSASPPEVRKTRLVVRSKSRHPMSRSRPATRRLRPDRDRYNRLAAAVKHRVSATATNAMTWSRERVDRRAAEDPAPA